MDRDGDGAEVERAGIGVMRVFRIRGSEGVGAGGEVREGEGGERAVAGERGGADGLCAFKEGDGEGGVGEFGGDLFDDGTNEPVTLLTVSLR